MGLQDIIGSFNHKFSSAKSILSLIPAIAAFYPISLMAKPFLYFIHGMGSNPTAMTTLENRFIEDGFKVASNLNLTNPDMDAPHAAEYINNNLDAISRNVIVSYDSRHETVEDAAMRLYNEMFPKKSGVEVALIAHSLGGLVARYIAEVINPQYERVNITKVVLLGTPNKGVALIDISKLDFGLRAVEKALFGNAAFNEIMVGSDLMHRLNDDGLADISYLVIAGSANDNQLDNSRYRAMSMALKKLYNCDNDGVVPIASVDISNLQGWGYDDEFHKVYSNHGGLLANQEVINEIEGFLRK